MEPLYNADVKNLNDRLSVLAAEALKAVPDRPETIENPIDNYNLSISARKALREAIKRTPEPKV